MQKFSGKIINNFGDETTLDNGTIIQIRSIDEEESELLAIEDNIFSPTKYQEESPFTKLVVSAKTDPDLLSLLLIHKNHFFLKEESTGKIQKDSMLPIIPYLINTEKRKDVLRKIEQDQPLTERAIQRGIESIYENLIELIVKFFTSSVYIFRELFRRDKKFKDMIMVRRDMTPKQLESRVKKIMEKLEDFDFEELQSYLSVNNLLGLDPMIFRDMIFFISNESVPTVLKLQDELLTAMSIEDYGKYSHIIDRYENFHLISPLLTHSYCANRICKYQSISLHKTPIDKCPECGQIDSVFSMVVYQFSPLIAELKFRERGKRSASAEFPFLISHYIEVHSENRIECFPCNYVRNKKNDNEEEIDVFMLSDRKVGVIGECEIFQQSRGKYDQVKSQCIQGAKPLRRKMNALNIEKGYLFTNLKSKKVVEKVEKEINRKTPHIRIVGEYNLTDEVNNIIEELT